jgi:hypothetical protein
VLVDGMRKTDCEDVNDSLSVHSNRSLEHQALRYLNVATKKQRPSTLHKRAQQLIPAPSNRCTSRIIFQCHSLPILSTTNNNTHKSTFHGKKRVYEER